MVNLNFGFGVSSVGRNLVVGGVCFMLAGQVAAANINSSFFSNILDKIVSEYEKTFTKKFIKDSLMSRGFAISLLDSNHQVITPRNNFYLGFLGKEKSYTVTLTGCKSVVSQKNSNSEHLVAVIPHKHFKKINLLTN